MVTWIAALQHGATEADLALLYDAVTPIITKLMGREALYEWSLQQLVQAVLKRSAPSDYESYVRGLVASGRIKPPTFYTYYKVKKGDILGRVAKKFDVSVRDIQKANGLRSTTIMAGKTYRIPRKGHVMQPGAIRIPPRRLPPATSGASRVAAPDAR